MGARFVPITVTVNGGSQGAAEINRLSASFNQLDNAANKTSGGGLKSAFNASNLVRTELQSLASQIPIVGRFFNAGTADLLNYAKAGQQVTAEMKQRKQAFQEFVKLIGDFTPGLHAGESLNIFGTLGKFDVSGGMLRDKEKAFGDFVKAFQSIEDPAQRAAVATAQFGAKGEALLPILENMTAEEAAMATQTGAVGGSMLAVLGPIALVVAAVAVLAAGMVLGGKALFDVTKLAADTGGEVYDLSQKINFTAETISGLSVAAKLSGSDIGALSSSLGIFDKNIQLAKESDTKLAKQFRDFNVDIRDNETALRSVFRALAALPEGEKQVELAMLAFGRSGKDVLGIVKETNGDLDLAIAKYQRMGLVISTEAAKAADQFGDQLDLLTMQLKMVAVGIGQQVMPFVFQLIKAFSDFVTRTGPEIKAWTASTIESFKNVGFVVKSAADSVAGFDTSAHTAAEGGILIAMGRIASLSTGVGVLVETLREAAGLLDKLGSYSRPPDQQGVPTVGNLDQQYQKLFAPKIVQQGFSAEQSAQFAKELAPFQSLFQGINSQVETFGEKTHLARVQQQAMKLDLKELSPQVRDAAAAYIENAKALARNLDAMEAAKKARDAAARQAQKEAQEAARQTEKITQENERFAGSIEALTQRHAELTQTQSTARNESEKFAEALAKGLFKNIKPELIAQMRKEVQGFDADVRRINQQKELDKLAESAKQLKNAVTDIILDVSRASAAALPESQQRAAALFAPLDQLGDRIANISELKIDRAKFQPILDLFKAAPEATDLNKAFNQFWGILDKEVQDNTAPQFIGQLVAAMLQMAKASRDLAELETPLGRAREENNRLLEEQQNLYDPLLVQQRLANEMLRDKIDLESRDLGAVVSLAKSQRELADATVYHSAQANASVAEFLARQKSVTQIVADAKTGVIQTTFDYLDQGLSKANSHLGRMGELLTQIEGDFIKLAATKFFQWLFGAGTTGNAGAASGPLGLFGGGGFRNGGNTVTGGFAGGTGAGQYLNSGAIFNMIRNGGGAGNYASGMRFLGNFGGEGITAPTTTLSTAVNGGLAANVLHEAGHVGAAAAAPGIFSGIGFGLKPGSGGALSAMLPLLGASLGMQAGGQSRFGQILGAGGGLLLGAGLVAAPSALAGTLLAPLFSNPITAIAGGALLVGALLAARNAQRRADETKRAELSGNVYNDTIQILNAARSGSIGYSEAMSQYGQVRTNYFAQVSQMKDAKTKRIATDWWNRDFDPVYRPAIEKAAHASDEAKARSGKLVPEFAMGGGVWSTVQSMRHLRFADGGLFSGRVPGAYDRRDNNLIAVSGDEVVLTPRQWKPITNYLKAVRVPGFADSGKVSSSSVTPSGGDGGGDIVFDVSRADDLTALLLELVLKGLRSPEGKKIQTRNTKEALVSRRL